MTDENERTSLFIGGPCNGQVVRVAEPGIVAVADPHDRLWEYARASLTILGRDIAVYIAVARRDGLALVEVPGPTEDDVARAVLTRDVRALWEGSPALLIVSQAD